MAFDAWLNPPLALPVRKLAKAMSVCVAVFSPATTGEMPVLMPAKVKPP